MTSPCPFCGGQLDDSSYKVHVDSCPSTPPKPIRNKNDMLAALGSAFRMEDTE